MEEERGRGGGRRLWRLWREGGEKGVVAFEVVEVVDGQFGKGREREEAWRFRGSGGFCRFVWVLRFVVFF